MKKVRFALARQTQSNDMGPVCAKGHRSSGEWLLVILRSYIVSTLHHPNTPDVLFQCQTTQWVLHRRPIVELASHLIDCYNS